MIAKRILLIGSMLALCTVTVATPFSLKVERSITLEEADTEQTAPVISDKIDVETSTEEISDAGETEPESSETVEELPTPDDIVIDVDRPVAALPGVSDEKPKEEELPYASDVGVFVPYDVPLSIEEQKFVEEVAARFNVHEELVYGVMWAESRYDRNAIGKNNRYLGIMQVSKSNLSILKTYCGVTNLMDFRQNVIAGCYFLGHYADLYDHNMNIMLLYYHGGYKYANPLIAQGIYEDSYTAEVFAEMNRILEIRKQTAAEMGVRIKGWLYEY